MNFSDSRPGGHWTIAFAAATFLTLILGTHSYIVHLYDAAISDWGNQFVRTIAGWYLWAAFFPLIFTLARRFHFAAGSRRKSAAVHILAGIGIAILHAILQIVIHDWLLNPNRSWSEIQPILENQMMSSLIWRFVVYQTILCVSIALDSHQRTREIEIRASHIESSILQSQIESLKTRLDPEFLFQSFRELSRLMRGNFDLAESLVARLGAYLRMRLDHSGTPETTLREEIEFLKCYIEIENMKRGSNAEVVYDLDQDTLDCKVPGMILQAAVEDAISKRTGQQSLSLQISVRKTGKALAVMIRDPTFDGYETPKLRQLITRLSELNQHPIVMHRRNDPEGVVTSIDIPLIRENWSVKEEAFESNSSRDGAGSFSGRHSSPLLRGRVGGGCERGQPSPSPSLDKGGEIRQHKMSHYPIDTQADSFQNPVRKWLVIIGIFTMLAVFFTIQRVIIHSGRGTSMNWPQHLLDYSGWYIWALITPFVLKVSSRYPLQGSARLKSAVVHFFAFLATWTGATLAMEGVKWAANLGSYPYLAQLPVSFARSPITLDVLCYSAIVAIESAARFGRRFEAGTMRTLRLSTQLARARLETLKTQLHPHFLFNSLNSLSELMQEDPGAAEEMIRNLEMFLRLTVHQNHLQEIPFEKEMEFLQCYLAIENVRYQERLNVTMDIEPQTLGLPVPSLLLQPIVENAIRHAIAPRTTPGQIEIQAKRNNGFLTLKVRDNGPGLRKTMPKNFRSGLGLANTRERLSQLYGKDHRFELVNAPEGGLIVSVDIPVGRVAKQQDKK